MDCDVITRVEVWQMTSGGTTICWELGKNFWPPEPDLTYDFYVDLGRPGTDEWIALNSEPVAASSMSAGAPRPMALTPCTACGWSSR